MAQMTQKDRVADAWTRYHQEEAGREPPSSVPTLSSMRVYQRTMIKECSKEIERRAKEKPTVRLWSAGSGIDFISLKLKQSYGGKLAVTVFDISPDCITRNKELFERNGSSAEFVVGDLFESSYDGAFDIVINTGLLEHFDKHAQETLLAKFSRSLVAGGVYLTVTPYSGARLYEYSKKRSIAKGSWPYGPESPIRTLRDLGVPALSLTEERQLGATDQLVMLKHAFPRMKGALGHCAELAERCSPVLDPVLRPLIGGYSLFDRFVKD